MPRPLDNSYESSSDDDDALRVDAAFAKAYSAREQKRLDARRAAGGDGVLDAGGASSSDSESRDDGAAALTPRVEADVLKTMAAIRRRDAAVYDGTTAFFADAPRARARAGAAEGAATTFKDLARARLAAGDAGADAGAGGAAPRHPHAYDAEQRALRQAMVEAGAGDADECALFHPKRAGGGGAGDRAPVRAALDELRAAPAGDTLQDAFLADFVAGRRWAAPRPCRRRPARRRRCRRRRRRRRVRSCVQLPLRERPGGDRDARARHARLAAPDRRPAPGEARGAPRAQGRGPPAQGERVETPAGLAAKEAAASASKPRPSRRAASATAPCPRPTTASPRTRSCGRPTRT